MYVRKFSGKKEYIYNFFFSGIYILSGIPYYTNRKIYRINANMEY